jgi:CRISPR-associated protein Csm1
MDEEYFEVCLCSLLHDIGKFAWRVADEKESKTAKGEWMSHEDWNKQIVRGTKLSFAFWNKIDTPQSHSVWLGDWISAQERDDLDEIKKETKEESILRTKTTPIISVFSDILKENKKDGKEKVFFCKHQNLSLNLPFEEDYIVKDSSDAIHKHLFDKNLFEHFREEIRDTLNKYDINDEEQRYTLLRNISDILKTYLIKIPSAASYSKSDIDLFNHSRMACAITSCLYQYYKIDTKNNAGFLQKLRDQMRSQLDLIFKIQKAPKEEKSALEKKLENLKCSNHEFNEKIFLLIRGNFSGIQDFVSMISSKRAIRILKARSFYLSFFNKALPLKMVKALDLPETNIIFSEGGNFEILCPNILSVNEKIKNLADEVNTFFWEKFRTKLFLEINCYEMSPNNFERGNFKNIFGPYYKDKINLTSKNTKFREELKKIILADGNQDYLNIGNSKCCICSMEMNIPETDKLKEPICETCRLFEELNKELKKWEISKQINGINSDILKINDTPLTDYFCYTGNQSFCPYLEIKQGIYEIFPLGLPINNNNDIIDFDSMVDKCFKRTGTRKLGALKLDVDNLGTIFREGIENVVLSRYAKLSFDIGFFFSGIIGSLREKQEYKDEVYIIYSGGDDSFIVGSWDKVLDFAIDLYNHFKIYVNHNPKITISASYNIFDEKFPVKKMFEITENGLEQAKLFDSNKSRISILNHQLKWNYFKLNFRNGSFKSDNVKEIIGAENELEVVIILVDFLHESIKKGTLPRGILSRMMFSANDVISCLKPRQTNIVPVWRMNYYFNRMINKDEKCREILKNIWETACFSDINTYIQNKEENFAERKTLKLHLIQVAAKIVQLKTRGGNENADEQPI